MRAAPPAPAGLDTRPPTLDDADGVAALITARDAADFGQQNALTGDDVRGWWRPDVEQLADDAWIVLDDGRVVGFARMSTSGGVAHLEDESCVHPDARGAGIGWHLVDLAEDWTRKRRIARLRASVVNDDGRRLLASRGFEPVRHFWRMEIDLREAEPPRPKPPAGFALRPYRPGEDDRPLYELHQAAFAEHWDFVPVPFEPWLRWRTERHDYDPALWQLAVGEGGEIVGAALCFGERDFGWVLDLAVGEPCRGRGLGLALLRRGFGELRRRGHTRLGLEVDSENTTGATRLYERAGMRVTRRYDAHEKRL